MRLISRSDLQALIDKAGIDGAKAALREAKDVTVEGLRHLARAEGLHLSSKTGREELIDTLVAPNERRIERPLSDLAQLTEERIADYLTQTACTSLELMRYMDEAKLPYDRGLTRNALIKHAAREISRIGLYQRIAGETKPGL